MMYISNSLRIQKFYLLTEEGEKIRGKNIQLINTLINNNKNITFVLVPEKYNVSPCGTLRTLTKSEVKEKIENQLFLKKFISNFLLRKTNLIIKKIDKLYKKKENFYSINDYINSKFDNDYSNFNLEFIISNEEVKEVLKKIEQSSGNFKNYFSLFLNEMNNLKEINEKYQQEIKRITGEDNKNKFSLIESLSFEELENEYKSNHNIIKQMLELKHSQEEKEITQKLQLIDLYKNNLEHENFFLSIPKQYFEHYEEIKAECTKCKMFDILFKFLMSKIEEELLKKEEKRRKEFILKIQSNKYNPYYFNFIYLLLSVFTAQQELKNDNIKIEIEKINEHINNISRILYNNNPMCITEIKSQIISKGEEDMNNEQIKLYLINILQNNFKLKIEPNKETIHSLLTTLKDKTYLSSTENLLDISNNSLACSLIFEDNKLNNFHRRNSTLSIIPNFSTEIEKIIEKYEDILFFYDTFFEYIKSYLISQKSKELNNLKKNIPSTLGKIIEQIVNENIALKQKFSKIIKHFNSIKNNNKL